jgi:hypothetical protein
VAVFGGTKTGKSICVNVLLAATNTHSVDCVKLLGKIYGRASLTNIAKHITTTSKLGQAVLWDTPDCDSVGSTRYMIGLVEALTQADAVVYVTSQHIRKENGGS